MLNNQAVHSTVRQLRDKLASACGLPNSHVAFGPDGPLNFLLDTLAQRVEHPVGKLAAVVNGPPSELLRLCLTPHVQPAARLDAALAKYREWVVGTFADWTPLLAPQPLVVAASGSPLADPNVRFRFVRRLGGGTYGDVFEGHDELLDRPVALKVLKPRFATAEGREQFLREARTAAKIAFDSANICHVIDVFETPAGQSVLVLELLSGSLKDEHARHGALAVGEVARIGRDLARGLEALNALGYNHLDVKPGNALRRKSGTCALSDFGLSRLVGAPGGRAGTPNFMAPEMLEGKPVSFKADVYSLGATLCRLLLPTGPQAVTPWRLRATAGRPFTKLVLQAVAKEPGDRPTASELAAELATFC